MNTDDTPVADDATPSAGDHAAVPAADAAPVAERSPAIESGAEVQTDAAPAAEAVIEATAHDAPRSVTPAEDGFGRLGLDGELLTALNELGYEEPTPIQSAAIPPLIRGRDLLGRAATGTGKTAAFALPILQRLAVEGSGDAPFALVLVPTRELAMQVSEAVHRYGRGIGARVLPIYGGQPIQRQLQALKRGVDVVVATPGRAIDHLNRRTLDLSQLAMVVLDEADEMLDMGFTEDIDAILAAAPGDRQTVLFSATMPSRIDRLARQHLTNPERIEIKSDPAPAGESPRVRQVAYVVPRSHKAAALGRLLDVESPTAAIVFCRTRVEVDQLTETLNGRGYRAEGLHGGMNQEQRDRVMSRLRSGTAELLIATDVAARGLDVDSLTHVVNYDVPSAPEAYVHRIGRVGRAGREGVAVTLAEPRERRLLKNIERLTGQRIAVDRVPTVADLRTRRLEQTAALVRDHVQSDNLDRYRGVLEVLTEDHDLIDVALAAIELVDELTARNDGDTTDIPDLGDDSRDQRRDKDAKRNKHDKHGKDRKDRKGDKYDKGDRYDKGDKGRKGGREQWSSKSGTTTRLFVGVGREGGVRPKDLVGAIAGESSLKGSDIGSIQITDRFSLVEVPEALADDVVAAMRHTTIKGRKAKVRRERF